MFTVQGLEDASPLLVICAPHRPPTLEPNQRKQLSPLASGDLHRLVQASDKHWRKIVNLCAKLLHGLTPLEPDWQTCREQRLLQIGSACALVFEQRWTPEPGQLCLVMGQTCGRTLGWLASDQVLPPEHPFVQDPEQAVIVSPYFDYRLLSNARLVSLVKLITDEYPHWLAAFSEQSHRFGAHQHY